jgi:hypothetical protein
MCHYITLVVRGSMTAAIAPIIARHGRRLTVIRNPSVASALMPGEAQFLTVAGQCDCGTVLAPAVAFDADHRVAQSLKLAKKGWSPSKIQRWLYDRAQADNRVRERRHDNQPDSLELWSGLVHDLLKLTSVQQAGLLLHFYTGDVETEVVPVTRREIGIDQFASRLLDFRENELLIARRN